MVPGSARLHAGGAHNASAAPAVAVASVEETGRTGHVCWGSKRLCLVGCDACKMPQLCTA
jgi:hypothetical protein